MDASEEQKAEFAAWLDTVRDAAEDADEEEPAAEPMDVDQQDAEQQDGQQDAEQQDEQQGDEQALRRGGEKELIRMREVFQEWVLFSVGDGSSSRFEQKEDRL